MGNKDRAILGTLGLTLVGSLAITIYAYGQMKFYEGRISKNEELNPVIRGLMDLVVNGEKKEA